MNVVMIVARGTAAGLAWLARAVAAAAAWAWQRTPRPGEIAESLAYSRARRHRAQAGRHVPGRRVPGPHHAGRRHPVWAPLRQRRRRAALATVAMAGAAVLATAGLLASQLSGSKDVSSTARASGSPAPRHAAARPFPVQVSAELGGQPGARQVAAFVAAYFAAVSAGDYAAWARLFLPAALLPPQEQFAIAARHDYQAVTLVGLVTADSTAAAQVTLASRPAAGALRGTTASCVLSFALFRRGGSYLLESLPYGRLGMGVDCGL